MKIILQAKKRMKLKTFCLQKIKEINWQLAVVTEESHKNHRHEVLLRSLY